MAIFANFSYITRLLDILGDSVDNSIDVTSESTGYFRINDGAVPIRVTSSPYTTPKVSDATEIRVDGGAGNDTVTITDTHHIFPAVRLFGGAGNDRLFGSQGRDVLDGGLDNDTVEGKRGDDTAFLGAGNDTFLWSPGDGNDIVEGQGDTDTIIFKGSNVSETYILSAKGERLNLFRDVTNVQLDANDVEQLELSSFGGTDSITIRDLSSNDVKQITLKLAGSSNPAIGDGQQDTVTIEGSGIKDTVSITSSTSEVNVTGLAASVKILNPDQDRLNLNLGAGDDVLDASSIQRTVTLTGPLALTVDGGIGKDTLRGSQRGDVLNGGEGDDLLAGDFGSDMIIGHQGRDSIRFNAPNEGVDYLQDFSVAEDMIQVKSSTFGGGLVAGTILSTEQFRLGLSARDANDRFMFDGRYLYYDADGTGSASQVAIASFNTGATLTATNIRIV